MDLPAQSGVKRRSETGDRRRLPYTPFLFTRPAIQSKNELLPSDVVSCLFLQDTEKHGYKGHVLCVEAFNKAMQSKDVFPHVNKDIKILDAGAGTGIIGEMLVKQGYTNIDGLDISQNMLDIAEKKKVYKRLICAPLSQVRIEEIQTAEYDVVLCAGTIVYGQAKPAALDECIRHVRPGEQSLSDRQS